MTQAATPIYDVAILTLKVPIKFDIEPNVRPICLPSLQEFIESGSGIVAGWGNIKYEGNVKFKIHHIYGYTLMRSCDLATTIRAVLLIMNQSFFSRTPE